MNLYFQILLYNSSEKLPRLLESFNRLTIPKGDSVTLLFREQSEVDSEVETCERIIKDLVIPEIKTIFTVGRNYGFGMGHNTLYKEETSKFNSDFFILNPDGLFMDDFVIELKKYLEHFKNKRWGMLEVHQFPVEHPKDYHGMSLETNWVSCAAALMNKKMFDKTGGFDDNIFMYGEDVDLSMRARIEGYKLYHMPTAKFIHISYGLDDEKDNTYVGRYIPASEMYLRHKYIGEESVEEFRLLLHHNPLKDDIEELYAELAEGIDTSLQGKIDILPDGDTYARHRW